MSNGIHQYILSRIQQRKEENNFRQLKVVKGLVDFYSNDYLGFARDEALEHSVATELESGKQFLGSTGSRLLSGNNEYVETLEGSLKEFYLAESALLFNSGFDANYGLLSTLPYRGDTIIYDELVHASMHDGMRNSKAAAVPFAHNSMVQLEERLKAASGLKYVVVESVYSMDGDFAPLKEIATLCKKYDAGLIVDEAHAVGIFGKNGAGRVVELGLQNDCLARVNTFGKALGAHGAVVLGTEDLKTFLVNYCRPFIFSTALPFHSLAIIKCAHQHLAQVQKRRDKVFALIQLFRSKIQPKDNLSLLPSDSAVQSVVVSGNDNIKQFAATIQRAGFDVRPILTPTVPKGRERIRICIHSFNSEAEVAKLAEVINTL